MPPPPPSAVRCSLVLLGLACSGLAAAQPPPTPGEDAFREAAQWTVQVRTSVSRAFIEDDQGSWFGAGMLVDSARGWVLTNAHVAGRSYGKSTVAFRDNRALPVRRLYVDPYLDVAVLKYEPSPRTSATATPTLACEGLPAVGHPVGAYGHPWGFRYTSTRGITSAMTTRLGVNMLQTDAPINEGNSGGPLISLESGRVVGINAAKIKEEAVEGLSFAVPMPYACTILRLLRDGQDPSPPERLVDFAHDENGERTMFVARSRLPAAAPGLRIGDEILATLDPERSLATETDLIDALRGRLDRVALKVRRGDQLIELRGQWPRAPRITERHGVWLDGALFAEAEKLTAGMINGSPALMVHHVEPGSDADSAGLAPFDLLISVGREPVDSLEALAQRVRQAQSARRPVDLMLLRLGEDHVDDFFVHQRRIVPGDVLEPVGR